MDQENEYRELTLGDIWRIFKKRFWIFLLVVVVVVAITGIYVYTQTPIYQASTTVKLEPQNSNSMADIFSQSTLGYGNTSQALSTEIELITSRSNIQKVIQDLDLIKYLETPVKSSNLFSKLIDRVLKRGESSKPKTISVEKAISTVKGWISVSPVKDTNIVRISVENANPTLAASVANDLAKVFNNQLANLAKQQYLLQAQFIQQQIPGVSKSLTDIENTIREFKEQNGIFELSSEANFLLQAVTGYDQQINSLQTSLAASTASIGATQKLLSSVNQTVVSATNVASNPIITQLKSKLVDLRVSLAGVEKLYPPTDQHVVSIKNEIQETESEIQKQVSRVVSSYVVSVNPLYQQLYNTLVSQEAAVQVTQATIDAMKKVRQTYEDKLQTLPLAEQKLADLERELSVKENLYTLLLQKQEETKISEAGVTGNSAIIDMAYASTAPVKPNKKLSLAIGGVLGIFLGLLLIFVVEYADRTLKEEEEIERVAGDISIVGRIPQLNMKEKTTEIFTADDPTSPASESIKIAMTNVLYSTTKNIRKILFTSPTPGDGKTLNCANMAQTFAQNGQKTLVIDLDMRRPRIEAAFGIGERAKIGITNCVVAGFALEKAIVNVDENLDILPVGPLPPNPTVILTSQKLVEVIDELSEKYDRILIDTPPALAAADAGIISRFTDGVVLVVKVGKTGRDSMRLAISNLLKGGASILGIMINGISSKNSSYYYYYYYYTEEGEKKRRKSKK